MNDLTARQSKARAWFEDWEPSRVSRYVYRCLS